MRKLDEGVWVADQPLRVFGVELGARMTVVRLASGGLLLHSPIRPSADLLDEVRALGNVEALVAPNRFHHLFAATWLESSPLAKLFVAPGLETKRADLPITGVLTASPDPLWSSVLDQVIVEGLPLVNEVVFFHASSGTLIVTDLAFHIGSEAPLLTQALFYAGGAHGRLAPTYAERLLVRDRARCRASLERILAWPFDRVVVAHGTVVESGGRDELRAGYSWLLDSA
jgi:hypothetical protein